MANIRGFLAAVLLATLITDVAISPSESNNEALKPIKRMGFMDPKTSYRYEVHAYNVTYSTTYPKFKSLIKAYRTHIDQRNQTSGDLEEIQSLKFKHALVDFDLHCQPTYCYLVLATSRSKRNIELYAWQRVQFDLQAIKDSFARPYALKIFNINSAFYIAIAQEQLHLPRARSLHEYEDHTRFTGSAILKFTKGQESNIKYHQFIKLPFDPLSVQHYVSYTDTGPSNASKPTENHYLVFSVEPRWHEPGSSGAYSFIWSPLNDYFWPFRLPQGVTIVPAHISTPPYRQNVAHKASPHYPTLNFPGDHFQSMNLSQLPPKNRLDPIETCFNQLQQVLASRELRARRLIDSSRSLWKSPPINAPSRWSSASLDVINVTAQVFVKGNVFVRGALLESPQITMLNNLAPNMMNVHQVSTITNDHSPAIVENRLRQAAYRLRYVRDKLSKAVFMTAPDLFHIQVNSKVNFFGGIRARHTIFTGAGISNADVRLNGIPFKQLENELVSLRGAQVIASKVVFTGNVVADLLEIHGSINGEYFLRDAVDITSRYVQIMTGRSNRLRGRSIYRFNSVRSPEIFLSHNATLNGISLGDLITTGPQAQAIYGRKVFEQLSMARLDIGNPHVLINNVNISRLATSAVFLQNPNGKPYQFIDGHHQTFLREVSATRLTLNNVVNQHINISLLIHDSVKTDDSAQQQISGYKRFQQGLKIARLTTDGAINDVMVNRILNLNAPNNNSFDYSNHTSKQISGKFEFGGPISVTGNLKAAQVNGIDISRYAVRRGSFGGPNSQPQFIRGKKIFHRPLRIIDRVGLLTPQVLNDSRAVYPLINELDIKTINPGIFRQMQNPALITIDELEIDGNLNLPTSAYLANGAPRTTFGNFSMCPLDVIRSKLVSGGPESQFIEVPTRIGSLRARSIYVEPKALNGFSFPADFVLKSTGDLSEMISNRPVPTEFIFGHKTFRHISIAPPLPIVHGANLNYSPYHFANGRSVLLGPLFSVNNISFGEIQTFVDLERQRNSTGETVLQTLSVHGNIFSKRINGNSWPNDILLKSVGANHGQPSPGNFHRRIYSPLVFLNESNLVIENQLVLRGPIQLRGRLNGINLTDFARKSVTYGDKDLLSAGRPLSNKVFAGGLSISSEVRAHGLIDGVNFDDMKRRVVLIGPPGNTIHVIGPKVFMSDVSFLGPLQVTYLNNLPVDHYLKRARYDPINNLIEIYGKKIVSGALVVNQNLVVQGLINKINFLELGQKAISIRPGSDNLHFNRTMTIEGNAYMDNLYVDKNEGTIDGVKLADLTEISQTPSPVKIPTNYPPRPIHYNGNVTYMRTTPPYATTSSYYTSRPRGFQTAMQLNPDLSRRPPMSILYELPQPVYQVASPIRSPIVEQQLEILRTQFVSTNIIQLSPSNELVIGFIDAPSRDISNLQLPQNDPPYLSSARLPEHFIQLDQMDFSFKPTTYHCRVGLSTSYDSPNSTQVICSVGDTDIGQLATLPVGSPNNAKFLKEANDRALFLLVSEDATRKENPNQCIPTSEISAGHHHSLWYRTNQQRAPPEGAGSVHMYLFHVLQNSSSLSSAFFDLYQTIDLPPIDSFEGFKFKGSTYALAVSRATGTVHLLILRGYSGFQAVSVIYAPGIDYVRVLYTADDKPSLILHQTDGQYRLMESVII